LFIKWICFSDSIDKKRKYCYDLKTERTLFLIENKERGAVMKRVYSLLVDNNAGVLSRIAGLFSRRGYSIDSITAGVTADPRFTRITIVASGDELILSQIEKQVRKLEDVIEIKVLDPADSVYRELIMVKIRADRKERAEIISVADIFRAKIVDVEQESLIVELTGTQSKLEAFLSLLEGYEILELARTGITGLNRGIKDVTLIDQEGNIRKI
jgi:acetolactate synthase-1/3 small subunit